jgi:hypothetical protein
MLLFKFHKTNSYSIYVLTAQVTENGRQPENFHLTGFILFTETCLFKTRCKLVLLAGLQNLSSYMKYSYKEGQLPGKKDLILANSTELW